jgi:hypothetical protein
MPINNLYNKSSINSQQTTNLTKEQQLNKNIEQKDNWITAFFNNKSLPKIDPNVDYPTLPTKKEAEDEETINMLFNGEKTDNKEHNKNNSDKPKKTVSFKEKQEDKKTNQNLALNNWWTKNMESQKETDKDRKEAAKKWDEEEWEEEKDLMKPNKDGGWGNTR